MAEQPCASDGFDAFETRGARDKQSNQKVGQEQHKEKESPRLNWTPGYPNSHQLP